MALVRGIRGAITVRENSAEEIMEATRTLIHQMMEENNVLSRDIGSIIFSLTEDLDAVFPAQALRNRGFEYVPLLDCREIPVPGSLGKCIRVLMLINTEMTQKEINHVYLGGARVLRKDLTSP